MTAQQCRFLRDTWLECCGHMSHFEIGGTQYSNCVPGPGDPPMFDTDLAEPKEQHMVHTVEETIAMGQKFRHEFDYGDTTCLDLELVGLPVLYGYVQEFINPPEAAEGYQTTLSPSWPATYRRSAVSPAAQSPAGATTRTPTFTCRPKRADPSWHHPTSATSARQMTSPPSSFGTRHEPAWAATTTCPARIAAGGVEGGGAGMVITRWHQPGGLELEANHPFLQQPTLTSFATNCTDLSEESRNTISNSTIWLIQIVNQKMSG